MNRLSAVALAAFIASTPLAIVTPAHALSDREASAVQRATPIDRSGHKRAGKASYYHPMFNGRRMADGKRFDPQGANAASRTLPLGTLAMVTNHENGRSAVVLIQDRGPYVDDRIIDLSPKTAQDLGIHRQGVAPVEVAPIAVPMPDGSMRPGAGASQADRLATSR